MLGLTLAMAVALGPSGFRHIRFDDLPPVAYSQENGALKIEVDAASSFLLQPFDAPKTVKAIRFEWKSDGALGVKDAAMQERKDGDDARLRIGLILAGQSPMIPFFAPAWIKAIRDHMKHPAGQIRFVLAGTAMPPNSSWPSPYNGDMRLAAAEERPLADGWKEGRFALPQSEQVVGLWIMADGDNTKSKFTTWLKALDLD